MSGEPVRIVSGGAAQGLVARLQPQFGTPIEGSFGAVGAMKDKLLAGEPCDVVVLTDALIRELEASGHVQAGSARAVGVVKTGIALKTAAPVRAVDSGAELKAILEAASEIYFPDPVKATAGIHFMKVLTALGLAPMHSARFRTYPNGATAMGAMALTGAADAVGCTQVTEILITPGVQLVALLPPPYELATTYTAAVSTSALQPGKAMELVELMSCASSAAARGQAGFA